MQAKTSLVLPCLLQALLILAESLSFFRSQLALDLPLAVRKFSIVPGEPLQLSLHIIQAGLRVRVAGRRACVDIVEHRAVTVQILISGLGGSFGLEYRPRVRCRALGRGS